jgi:salicylate hydroxylase
MSLPQLLIAGGGMGGLAAALACARAGWQPRIFEQAKQFSEVGAGIQLGPNATRILGGWGLAHALSEVAAFPQQLRVRSAHDGAQLGVLRLGEAVEERYGAPYATVHRADLQAVLVEAVRAAGFQPTLSSRVIAVQPESEGVTVAIEDTGAAGGDALIPVMGDALIGADGLWSSVREHVWHDEPPQPTGHVAYRGVVPQADLPAGLRSNDVNVWLGPRMHLVAYPVRGGSQLNVVVIVQGQAPGPAQDWDQEALAGKLQETMGKLCTPLRDRVCAMPSWRLWALNDRIPVRSADEMARGRVALLGDAAHPMRPYFAQGACMAIEDAAELARLLSRAAGGAVDVPQALRAYALNRWQRDARVQALSRRNGRIFHATGLVRWGRDLALRMSGERLLDQPWLYGVNA